MVLPLTPFYNVDINDFGHVLHSRFDTGRKLFPFIDSWQPIIDFIQKRFDEYIQQESRVDREYHIVDTRVHCCLYFIPPTGHR